MNQQKIERRAKLLSAVILDLSNVPAQWQQPCMEYELARESAGLRTAVTVRRRFNDRVVVRNRETIQQAHERTRRELSEPEQRELDDSDRWLYERGWSFLLEYAGYPEKPWKETLKTSVNRLFENLEDSDKDRKPQERSLHFWGYASEKDFKVVKMFHPPGQEAATSEPFILLQVNLDGNNKSMRKDLDRIVAYLRRTFDNVQESRGESRRFGKRSRRPSGGIPAFDAFVRSLNAMRVLAGAKHFGLLDKQIVECISACGFSRNANPSKGGQRYPGVEAAKKARQEFLKLFHHYFGSDAVPLTNGDPSGTLNLKG